MPRRPGLFLSFRQHLLDDSQKRFILAGLGWVGHFLWLSHLFIGFGLEVAGADGKNSFHADSASPSAEATAEVPAEASSTITTATGVPSISSMWIFVKTREVRPLI